MDKYESHLQEFLFIAIEALNEGIYNKAIAACELALEADSECVAAMVIMGNTHYCKKNYKVAQRWYEKAFDLYPSTKSLVNMGLAAIQSNDVGFAEVVKDTVFQPINTSVGHELTAMLLCKDGKYDEAEQYFKSAMNESVPKPRLYANYGTMMLERYLHTKADINDVHRAIDMFNSSLEISLFNKYAMYNRCRAYYTLGEYSKALKDAKELIKFDKEDPGFYYLLAEILFKLERYKDALKYVSYANLYGCISNRYVAEEATKLKNEIHKVFLNITI